MEYSFVTGSSFTTWFTLKPNVTALIDGLHFNFVRATEEQIEKYKEEAEVFHGGSAEDATTDTSISDKDAEEPSRAPLR